MYTAYVCRGDKTTYRVFMTLADAQDYGAARARQGFTFVGVELPDGSYQFAD